MRCGPLVLALLGFMLALRGDSLSSTYQQAAQAYYNAAAQCNGPGSACYLAYAQYYTCVANSLSGGGGCTQPTCTPGCQASGGGTSLGLGGMGSAGSLQSARLQQFQSAVTTGIGLLQQWMQARAQRKALEQQAAQDQQSQALQAQLEAARQREQQLQDEATALLASANGTLSDSQQVLQTPIPCLIDFNSDAPPKYCPETRIPSSINFNTGEVTYDPAPVVPPTTPSAAPDSGSSSNTPTLDSLGQAGGGSGPGPGAPGQGPTPTLDQLSNKLTIGTPDPQ